MYQLTILGASEEPVHLSLKDNSLLWCSEAKPLAPPTLTDENAQEIVVAPGTADELRLVFNTKESDLNERVAGICNSLMSTSGMRGVQELAVAIGETGYRFEGRVYRPIRTPQVRGEQTYVNAAASPRRHALKLGVEAWQANWAKFAKAVIDRVQSEAVRLATVRLERSSQIVLTQSVRYFKGSAPRPPTSSNAQVHPEAALLGPDVEDLLEAIAEIAAMRREIEFFDQQAWEAKQAARRVGLTEKGLGTFGPLMRRAAINQDLRAMLEVPSATSALARATQGFDAATRVFAQACAEKCRLHPVLRRLWDHALVLEIGELWNRTPATERLDVINADGRLAALLSQLLNGTAKAAESFIAELRSNPDGVWKYPPAIRAALEALYLNEGDLAWRVVEDHLAAIEGSMSELASISLGLGVVELIAGASAVAPPVAVAIAILSAGAAVAELIESAMEEARKDRAFAACLDPADSLAVEGGSYVGVVVSAVFILLQLRGVKTTALKALTP